MDTRLQVARLEIELRGWANAYALKREGAYWIQDKTSDACALATPHDTPEGREQWCELLELDVVFEPGDDAVGIPAHWVVARANSRFHERLAWDSSRPIAITAAVEALAKENHEAV